MQGLFVISVVSALLSLRLHCPVFWCHEMRWVLPFPFSCEFSFEWWLVASSFESKVFVSGGFVTGLIAAFWDFSRYAQLSDFMVCASSFLRCMLRSLTSCPFSIRCLWRLLLFLVSSEVC